MKAILCASMLAVTAISTATQAAPINLVQNGGFEQTTNGTNFFLGYGDGTNLVDWSYASGNAAVFDYYGATVTGACGGPGCTRLYSGEPNPADPSHLLNPGFTASPAGGNFVASDGDLTGPLFQVISGLKPGGEYAVSFYWTGNEYFNPATLNYGGPVTAAWEVSLGSQTFETPFVTSFGYANKQFPNWILQSFTFTATSTSEALVFLAQGTPAGGPPVALLDGVTLNAVPEPSTWAMVLVGIGGLGLAARSRRKSRETLAAGLAV